MRSIMNRVTGTGAAVAAAVAMACVVLLAGSVSALSEEAKLYRRFELFEAEHSKSYVELGGEELRTAKYAVFKANMARADEWTTLHNGTARFGATRWADLTSEEFVSSVLMKSYKPMRHTARDVSAELTHPKLDDSETETESVSASALGDDASPPTAWNWTAQGKVTPVRDQGSCGACWAFAATAEVESMWLIKSPIPIPLVLSPQQLIDCDVADSACTGGSTKSAFEYIWSNTVNLDVFYPYTGVQSDCKFQQSQAHKVLSSGDSTTPGSVPSSIAAYIYSHGPATAALDATHLQLYQSGVMTFPKSMCPTMSHIVLLTGYDMKAKYLIAKNSWGSSWGENGYFRINPQSCMIDAEVIGSADAA